MTDPLKAFPPEQRAALVAYGNLRVAGVQKGHAAQENKLRKRIALLESQLRKAGLEPIEQQEEQTHE